MGLLVLLCFITGMLAEILGVRYGFIFGEYSYGNALGTKVMGVPLMIGVNWCILIFITGFIAQFFPKKTVVQSAFRNRIDVDPRPRHGTRSPCFRLLDLSLTGLGFFSQLFRMGFGCFSTTTCFSQSQN